MSYVLKQNHNLPKEAVVLSDSVYHSYLGEYFLGQTEMIQYGGDYYAWGGLVNPESSKVTMYLNAYTISNFSNIPITAEGWLSSTIAGDVQISRNVLAGNQSLTPPTLPKVKIQSASFVRTTPSSGAYTFVRRVEPNITLTKHDFQGMYIIPPGSSFVLFFMPVGNALIHVKIAFGWWEECM